MSSHLYVCICHCLFITRCIKLMGDYFMILGYYALILYFNCKKYNVVFVMLNFLLLLFQVMLKCCVVYTRTCHRNYMHRASLSACLYVTPSHWKSWSPLSANGASRQLNDCLTLSWTSPAVSMKFSWMHWNLPVMSRYMNVLSQAGKVRNLYIAVFLVATAVFAYVLDDRIKLYQGHNCEL